MPFVDADDNPVSTVDLRQVGPKAFQLMKGFTYAEPGGRTYPIPAHDLTRPHDKDETTDLASVPPLLWGLIASYGHQTRAALLHDRLSLLARRQTQPSAGPRLRREADRLFRVALLESDVPWLRCWLMWAAVSIDRYLTYARPLGWIMSAQIALAAGWLLLAPLSFSGVALLAALAAPLAASVLWGRDAGVVALASYASVVMIPVILVGAVAAVTLWLPSTVHWALTDRTKERFPTPAPYHVQPRAF